MKAMSCSWRYRKNSLMTIWVAARPDGVFIASGLANETPPTGRSHHRSRPEPRSIASRIRSCLARARRW